MYLSLCLVISCVCLTSHARDEIFNPYQVLGVSKHASLPEIRSAYIQLVKIWHPDKSDKPDAQQKFVQIKQAYELLSDTERRLKYDNTGVVEETFKDHFDYKRFENPFWFNIFHQENDIAFYHRLSITARHYDKILIPKSAKMPYIIFFYSDWCFSCIPTVPYFKKLIDNLEPLGIAFVAVHYDNEANLARRLNVHTLPCLVFVIDGNGYVYKDTITSIQRIIEFVRNHFPYRLTTTITDTNINTYLNGWEDNKVRSLIFEPKASIRLRYLIMAYYYRERVRFGFVNSTQLREYFQVSWEMDTVLLFNENISRPIASISMKEIPTQTLHHIISSNQYLALPRLSSQNVLDSLCPCEWNKPRKRLCVILITMASSDHDSHRQSFRTYAQMSPYSVARVRFAYIYHEKQTEFVNALIPKGGEVEPLLSIVIIWRRDTSHVKYEWLPKKWKSEENLNDTVFKLESTIARLLRSSEALSYEALVKDLFDEHAKGIFGRILTKVAAFWEKIYGGLGKEHVLPLISVVCTAVFIIGIGYLMSYLVRKEEESIREQNARKQSKDKNKNYQPELRLHELRAEKYNGLLRMLKPGCRTIILLLDMQSRKQLIPPFHKAVWPYRKNKTLMFGYMYIERGLEWYKELIQMSLAEGRELRINPRNCVGTVLSINGYRKYFCMFHIKHTERRKPKKINKIKTVQDCEAAAFIGFNSDTSEESENDILLEENLLDGLPNWLDRLFEGSTQRYHFNYWPDFPNK